VAAAGATGAGAGAAHAAAATLADASALKRRNSRRLICFLLINFLLVESCLTRQNQVDHHSLRQNHLLSPVNIRLSVLSNR
jgi:hypothetical protein